MARESLSTDVSALCVRETNVALIFCCPKGLGIADYTCSVFSQSSRAVL